MTSVSISKNKYYSGIITAFYLAFVLYITLLARTPSLTTSFHTRLLWSFFKWFSGNATYGRSIILNIGLFVPLGFFLSTLFRDRRLQTIVPVLLCLLVSTIIETTQYFTHLGTCDCDDLINNFLGGTIGVLLFRWITNTRLKIILSILFIAAGIAGCIVASGFRNVTDDTYLRQFDFDISSVSFDDGYLLIEGYCSVYDMDTPDYQIILKDKFGDQYPTIPIREDKEFSASVNANADQKYEVIVQFDGYKPMSTATYINRIAVEYVAGEIGEPHSDSTELKNILSNALLKAYNAEHEVYVYQVEDELYWLIGTEIDENTEIIYHLHTNEPDILPKERIRYGFDNLGFRSGTGEELVNIDDHYRVFVADIPTEYLITAITVGFSTNRTVEWMDYFRISRDAPLR